MHPTVRSTSAMYRNFLLENTGEDIFNFSLNTALPGLALPAMEISANILDG
jgi:hypothetical protein